MKKKAKENFESNLDNILLDNSTKIMKMQYSGVMVSEIIIGSNK
jgi:hypothetical protein